MTFISLLEQRIGKHLPSMYYLNYTILTVGLRETLQFKLKNILSLALKEAPKRNYDSVTVCRASAVCIAFFPLHVLRTTHSKLSTLMWLLSKVSFGHSTFFHKYL